MAIMALFRSTRVDQALYDAIIKELDLEQRPAAGALTHACGFDAKGICVVDVWETREAFDAFVGERLRPVFDRLGAELDPPEVLETYAFNVTEGVDRYKPELATA